MPRTVLHTRFLNPHMHAGQIGEHDLQTARIAEQLSIGALRTGTATANDVGVLLTVVRLSRALHTLGIGDEADVMTINTAGALLRQAALGRHGSIGLDEQGIDALHALVLLLDAQREAAGGATLARALLVVQRQVGR